MMNPAAERLVEVAMLKYSHENYQLTKGCVDEETGCSMQFVFGRVDEFSQKYWPRIHLPNVTGQELALFVAGFISQHLYPYIKDITDLQTYLALLTSDREPYPWLASNPKTRAAIVAVSRQLDLSREQIRDFLRPYDRWITMDLVEPDVIPILPWTNIWTIFFLIGQTCPLLQMTDWHRACNRCSPAVDPSNRYTCYQAPPLPPVLVLPLRTAMSKSEHARPIHSRSGHRNRRFPSAALRRGSASKKGSLAKAFKRVSSFALNTKSWSPAFPMAIGSSIRSPRRDFTMIDDAPINDALAASGYKAVRPRVYRAQWSSTEVEHFLYVQIYNSQLKSALISDFAIRAPKNSLPTLFASLVDKDTE